jgi:hypothetical protein
MDTEEDQNLKMQSLSAIAFVLLGIAVAAQTTGPVLADVQPAHGH